ncbi:hypothetical protein RND71_041746 [Anisodus tanguticus]|uniref:Uncharacterized protein n=1 Tax=Anisodus tanguticus TaxID=243964 RepID=A0AAE1UWZ7_9SOLA|nr:hypothetical protein RND71_041746 [Anisodus tanguticus]
MESTQVTTTLMATVEAIAPAIITGVASSKAMTEVIGQDPPENTGNKVTTTLMATVEAIAPAIITGVASSKAMTEVIGQDPPENTGNKVWANLFNSSRLAAKTTKPPDPKPTQHYNPPEQQSPEPKQKHQRWRNEWHPQEAGNQMQKQPEGQDGAGTSKAIEQSAEGGIVMRKCNNNGRNGNRLRTTLALKHQ